MFVWLLDLNIGIIFFIFYIDGNIVDESDLLNKKVREVVMVFVEFLRSWELILFSLIVFLVFSEVRYFLIKCFCMLENLKIKDDIVLGEEYCLRELYWFFNVLVNLVLMDVK